MSARPPLDDMNLPPPPAPAADHDRGISPVASRLSGSRSRWISLAALALGCGVFLMASWDRGDAEDANEEARAREPARQVVPFEPARAEAGPPLLDDGFDPDAPILTDEAYLVQAAGPDTASGEPRGPTPAETRAALLESAQRAPVIAWRRAGQSQTEGNSGAEPGPSSQGGTPTPTRLENLRQHSSIGRSRAGRLGDRNLLITAGSIIPCVLQTAMDTNTPGYVSCLLPDPVYSENGAVILLERGARVLGEYNAGLRQGDRRLFVAWTRAVTPGGVTIDLASPATDPLGRAGFDGQIDNRFWDRFSGALLLSIVDEGTALAKDGSDDGRWTRSASSAPALALEGSRDIAPTLRKDQGSEVSIFVAQDLDFTSVYSLRRRQ